MDDGVLKTRICQRHTGSSTENLDYLDANRNWQPEWRDNVPALPSAVPLRVCLLPSFLNCSRNSCYLDSGCSSLNQKGKTVSICDRESFNTIEQKCCPQLVHNGFQKTDARSPDIKLTSTIGDVCAYHIEEVVRNE